MPQHPSTFGCRLTESTSFNQNFIRFTDQTGSSSRATKVLFQKLGKINSESKYPVNSSRLRYFLYRRTISEGPSCESQSKSGGKKSYTIRSSGNVEERCYSLGAFYQKGVFEQYIFGPKKGWEKLTSGESETFKQFYTLSAFQNGGSASHKRSSPGERPYDKNRPKRCIFWHTSTQGCKEIYTVSLGRKFIRIPMPVLWSRTSSSDFYKTAKNSYSSDEENQYKDNNFSRRYAPHESEIFRTDPSSGNVDFSVTKFGFCDKFKKISIVSSKRDGVSWSDHQLKINDFSFTSAKGSGYPEQMCTTIDNPTDHNYGINQTHRKNVFHSAGCSPRKNQEQISAESSNSSFEEDKLISGKGFSVSRGQGGAKVVEGEAVFTKWQTSKNSNVRKDNSDRCLKIRFGGSLSRIYCRGEVVCTGAIKTHQCVGANCSQTCTTDIHPRQVSKSHTFANRQYNCIDIPNKDGGYSQQRTFSHSQGNLGILVSQADHNYSRVSAKRFKLSTRLAVQESPPGLQRLETRHKSFFSNIENARNSPDRSLCITFKSPAANIHDLATRTRELCSGLSATVLEKPLWLRIPSILHDKKSICKSDGGESSIVNHNNNMADTTLVHNIVVTISGTSNSTTQTQNIVTQSTGFSSSTSSSQSAAISDLEGFRRTLASEGISGVAASLISYCRRQSSISNYQSAWGKWSCWCFEREIDPFASALSDVLNFLAELYKKKFEHSSINVHRSAILAYHTPVNGNPVGQHPRVCALMTGIFNNRPPKPRSCFVWDIETVLSYLDSLPDNKNLSVKVLTHKLALLLVLTAVSQSSEICNLDTRYMVKTGDKFIFTFARLTKTWRRDKSPHGLLYTRPYMSHFRGFF